MCESTTLLTNSFLSSLLHTSRPCFAFEAGLAAPEKTAAGAAVRTLSLARASDFFLAPRQFLLVQKFAIAHPLRGLKSHLRRSRKTALSLRLGIRTVGFSLAVAAHMRTKRPGSLTLTRPFFFVLIRHESARLSHSSKLLLAFISHILTAAEFGWLSNQMSVMSVQYHYTYLV